MQVDSGGNLKEQVRETVLELFENEPERLYPLFIEIMEDIALSRAMEKGAKTRQVNEEIILELLK